MRKPPWAVFLLYINKMTDTLSRMVREKKMKTRNILRVLLINCFSEQRESFLTGLNYDGLKWKMQAELAQSIIDWAWN